MPLMPREKLWSKEGVTLTYLTYPTMLSLRVGKEIEDAYRRLSRSPDFEGQTEIPILPYIFKMAMPCITSVTLIADAPLWGEQIKEEIARADWLQDPVADLKRLERYAEESLLHNIYEGYEATRESTYLAPTILRNDPPENPELDLAAMAARNGERDPNDPFTTGGRPSKKKSASRSPLSLRPDSKAR